MPPKVFSGDMPAAWERAASAHAAAVADAVANGRQPPHEPERIGRLVAVQASLRRSREDAEKVYSLFVEAERLGREGIEALDVSSPGHAGLLRNALRRVEVISA